VNASMIETLLSKTTYSNAKIKGVISHKLTPIEDCIRFSSGVYKKHRAKS
jgi:hypothetical protein